MDAFLRAKAEQLASKFAGEAKTAGALNSLMLLIIKSEMERVLDTETGANLGRRENFKIWMDRRRVWLTTLVSEVTADLDAKGSSWRTRQLDDVWPIACFDGIVVYVRGANSAKQSS